MVATTGAFSSSCAYARAALHFVMKCSCVLFKPATANRCPEYLEIAQLALRQHQTVPCMLRSYPVPPVGAQHWTAAGCHTHDDTCKLGNPSEARRSVHCLWLDVHVAKKTQDENVMESVQSARAL